MKHNLYSRSRSIAAGVLAVVLGGLAASPALAATTTTAVDTSACTAPQFSQPFLSLGDSNLYALAPGQSVDNFAGGGWTLTGGAQVKQTTVADGKSGQVLDLPSGSQAVSPAMCVSSNYPTGRTMVRDVTGSEGVQIQVGYAGTKTAVKPVVAGQVNGSQGSWSASNPFNIHPGNQTGWQLVQFTLVPGGKSSEFQISNFYVDPRMSN